MSSDFVIETEDGEEEQLPNQPAQTSTQPEPEFHRRYLNDKWYGRYGDGEILEFKQDEWKPLASDDDKDFVAQLWLEQEANEKQANENFIWNEEKQLWEPKTAADLNEDFIAQYQANYGVQYDDIYKKMDDEIKAKTEKALREEEERKEKKKMKKSQLRVIEQKEQWVDFSDKVHAVYVTNLPTDIDESEFIEFMSKCGVIQPDARTNKPKVKLYKDENGDLKGDGRCCYIRKESVELACEILDGAQLKGKTVHVEEARFEMKGEFDPSKKKRKLTAEQKKRYLEQQNRIFEWKPEKPRNYRPISDCVVIIKNVFELEEMRKNAALLFDIKEQMEQVCQKYGKVKKVLVYDNHPEGVVSVSYTNTEDSDLAVKYMHERIMNGRKLSANLWDGRTKYKIKETEEEEEQRRKEYEKFISGGKESSDDEDEEKDNKRQKMDE